MLTIEEMQEFEHWLVEGVMLSEREAEQRAFEYSLVMAEMEKPELPSCGHPETSVETEYDPTGREVAFRVCEDCGKTLGELGYTGSRV